MSDNAVSLQTIDALSSTMLIPLWAKAVESRKENPLLYDAQALSMFQSIDYDFAKLKQAKSSQIGCCARALVLDEMAQDFIAKYPDAIIVHLGAGLDARYERLGQPDVSAWYDVDLPDVMALRRQLLPESNNHYLAMSLFDRDWIIKIQNEAKPVLLIAEGVLMYFTSEELRNWFAEIAKALPQAEMIFDVIPNAFVGREKRHAALRRIGEKPPAFKWGISSIEDLAAMGLVPVQHVFLSTYCRKRYPWHLRLMYLSNWAKRHLDMQIIHARF